MSAVVIAPDSSAGLGFAFLDFDLTISESHDATSEITSHPVETGSNISDNARPNPREFSCEVFITNTPIDANGANHAPSGSVGTVVIPYPVYHPPLALTPGSLFSAIGTTLSDLIFGAPPPLHLSVLQFPIVFDAITDTHNKLLQILAASAPCTVYTMGLTYDNMLLQSVSLPRDRKGGASFNLSFRQVITVATSNVKAPKPMTPRGAPGQSKGSQSTKPGSPAPPAASLAVNFLKSAGIVQ